MKSQSKYPVLDDALIEHIAGLDPREANEYLFLTPHKKYPGRWYVDALSQGFFLDFEEQIGKYRTVSPASLERFLERAEDLQYRVVFEEDPTLILQAWEHLNDPPAFSLNSDMPDTINGMLSFQLQGFNYLRQTPKGGIALWSTGTGKTALEAALIKQHMEIEDYQLGLVVCKRNNKADTQRKLLQLGSIDYAHIMDGTPIQREEAFGIVDDLLAMGDKLVLICNYEKLRDETEAFMNLVDSRDVVIFWDEMPTKLSNRGTVLYDATRTILYATGDSTVKWDKRRPRNLRQYDLTATPIENSPVGLLNQIRLIDPHVWPTIKGWEKTYVRTRNRFSKEPETFSDLDRMGLEIGHMVHQVDKKDPDIATLFPKVREEVVLIDWSSHDRRIYDKLQDIAKDLVKRAKEDPEAKKLNPLQLIGVLQMLCDAPSMVQKSAENRVEFEAILAAAVDDNEAEALGKFVSGSEAALLLLEGLQKPITDDHCEKIEKLREWVCEKHPDEKIIVFSRLANYIQPVLEAKFQEWGVSYVVYRGTEKQRNAAKDAFRFDPDIRIFLSSDIGSDSIDLPEANGVINYDLPLVWARKIQRVNRAHRVNSKHAFVWFADFLMANSVEERIAEIVAKKKGFHDGVFGGEIAEESLSARMTSEDLWYLLTGELVE